MTVDKIMNYFSASNTMEILLAVLILLVIVVTVKMTCNPNDEFDLKDLVSSNGHVDEKKFTRFGAWVVSTWGFVYLLVSKPETFPEWYFTVYMGAWVANAIMDKYMNTTKPGIRTGLARPVEAPPPER